MSYFGVQTRKSILESRSFDNKQAPNLKSLETPLYVHLVPQEGSIYRFGYHYAPTIKKVEKNNKTFLELGRTVFTCLRDTEEGCPICDFLTALSKCDEFESDEIIMKFKEGRKINTFTLNDLIGKSSQYQKSMRVTINALIAYVDHYKPDAGQQPLIITNGLLNKIALVIEDSVEEGFGDPLEGDENFAIKLNYDSTATTKGETYTASAAYKKIADDDILDALNEELIDLESYIKEPNRAEMLKYLNQNVLEEILDILEIPQYDGEEDKEDDYEVKERPVKKKSLKKSASRKSSRRLVDEDDDYEEEKPKRALRDRSSRKRRPTRKPSTKRASSLRCPSCREYIDAVDNECEYCGYDLGDDYDD